MSPLVAPNLNAVNVPTVRGVRMTNPEGVQERGRGRAGHRSEEHRQRRVALTDVEVPRHDYRIFRNRPRFDALLQQLRAALARRLRFMVEMHVEMIEAAAVAVDESRPRADAGDVVAPGLRRGDRRRVREPERSRLCHAEPILPEQDGRVLARPRRVVAPDADHGIHRDRGDNLVDLRRERLLQADNVGVLLADDVEEHLAPGGPVVLAVLRGAVSDVEGHQRERLPRRHLRGDSGRTAQEDAQESARQEQANGAAGRWSHDHPDIIESVRPT